MGADSGTTATSRKVPTHSSCTVFFRKRGLGMVEPCGGEQQGWAGTYIHPDTLACAHTHPPCVCTSSPSTHKNVEELEDALVCQDVQDIARDGLDDRQAMDLVLDQGVDSVEEAAGDGDTVRG